ncbi:MAG: DoxX family protein [Gemmatimonadota bacterium]
MSQHAHWLLRLPFAAGFLAHGLGKLIDPGMAASMQLPTALFLTVGVAEVLAGTGALVGGLGQVPKRDVITRLAGLAGAPVMLGAIALVHWPQWSFAPTPGKPIGGMEFQVLVLLVALYFIVAGGRAAGAKRMP